MDQVDSVSIVLGIVFAVYMLLATSYWSAAERWSDKASREAEPPTRAKAVRERKRAETMFNLCTGLAVVTIILTVIPIYTDAEMVTRVCKWLLLFPLAGMIIIGGVAASRRYIVAID